MYIDIQQNVPTRIDHVSQSHTDTYIGVEGWNPISNMLPQNGLAIVPKSLMWDPIFWQFIRALGSSSPMI